MNWSNSNNDGDDCHTFSKSEVMTILNTKTAIASLSLVACLATLILMCALTCWQKIMTTFVGRLKFYLTAVALVLSLMYLLQVQPVEPQVVGRENYTTVTDIATKNSDWNRACKGIAFLLQYVSWVMLLLIGWMIVLLLWYSHRLQDKQAAVTLHQDRKTGFEVGGIVFTLLFPLLFLWIPFVSDNYGLAGQWCGIIVRSGASCDSSGNDSDAGSLHPGLGLQIGLWYGPAILIALICIVGLNFVVYRFWVYYKLHGHSNKMTSAIIKGIPPTIYLVIYNMINIFNATSIMYYNITVSHDTQYRLSVAHAITGPSRALAVPFAFVLSHLIIHCYFNNNKKKTYTPIV